MTQIEKLRFIRDHLSEEDILCQLAKEAAELAQAALKLRRAMTGTNPTPVGVGAALAKLREEMIDVKIACEAMQAKVSGKYDDMLYETELNRWVERLKQREEEHPCQQS